MSDNVIDWDKSLAKAEALEKQKQANAEKRIILDAKRLELDYARLIEQEHNFELAKTATFGSMNAEEVQKVQLDNTQYMNAAKKSMTFIIPQFKGFVPYFRKNLIFFGGKSGEGKSTTVANIVAATIKQINPETGKPRRCLVITNEEKSADVFNRVTCVYRGWHYVNHDKFTDEQREVFDRAIPALAKDGKLTVVDSSYNGMFGVTTTYEGICNIFDSLIRNNEFYDVVIIDYYQNIKESINDSKMTDWMVQARLAAALDQYKNLYPAPIVVMGQVKPQDKDGSVPFETRIKGSKAIYQSSTCSVEIIADRESLTTRWVVHKSRFNEALGAGLTTGYDRGKYVIYGDEFRRKVNEIKEARMRLAMIPQIGQDFDKE